MCCLFSSALHNLNIIITIIYAILYKLFYSLDIPRYIAWFLAPLSTDVSVGNREFIISVGDAV